MFLEPTRAALPLLALLLLGPGCGDPGGAGTDSGNALTAQLAIAAEGDAVSARGVATVSGAWMNLAELEFAPCDGGADVEIDYEGAFAVDILEGTPLPVVELSFDTVCELEFEAEPAPTDGDSELSGLTVYIEGTTLAGRDLMVASAASWEFEIEEEVPLAEALNRFSLLFDVDRWFDGVEPDDGTVEGGVVFIDGVRNSDLLLLIEANIAESARLIAEG